MLSKLLFLLLVFVNLSYADEVRPSYLELKERTPSQFFVTFKVPARGDQKLSLHVQLPASCQSVGEKHATFTGGAYLERWQVHCSEGIREEEISIEGLQNSNTDLLLRLELYDGSAQSIMLTPTQRSYSVLKETPSIQVAKTYTWLGITHILMGYDHLMFVFALLLIVKSVRRLLVTITAFTLAHSITLAGATLGFVHVPQAPVEAVIALSILFLAVEIMKEEEGAPPSLTARYPWVVAFIFGLLHGFGFAGALTEVGVPENAITIALIFFNVGVEIGQLLFVSSVMLISLLLIKLQRPLLIQKLKIFSVYIIGATSAFWLIDRLNQF